MGEPETNAVHERLLSVAEYQRRYEAFVGAIDELGVPMDKLLYRSQLVRRLVHRDPNAPSNEKPVLWGLEPAKPSIGVVLRFASAVRSR